MKLPAGVEMVCRRQRELRSDFDHAVRWRRARFAIREGGHTVGAGAVTEVIE